jgi:hypothetical protein
MSGYRTLEEDDEGRTATADAERGRQVRMRYADLDDRTARRDKEERNRNQPRKIREPLRTRLNTWLASRKSSLNSLRGRLKLKRAAKTDVNVNREKKYI